MLHFIDMTIWGDEKAFSSSNGSALVTEVGFWGHMGVGTGFAATTTEQDVAAFFTAMSKGVRHRRPDHPFLLNQSRVGS